MEKRKKSGYGMAVFYRILRRLRSSIIALFSLLFIILLLCMALFAPFLATHDPTTQNILRRFERPSQDFLLGTDSLGRDIFSQIVYGTRISLFVGIAAVLLGAFVGVFLGLIGGYFGGITDTLIMRIVDLMLSFPGILLAITIAGVLGPGLFNVILAVGIWSIPTFARLTRSSVLSLKEYEFVEAARSLGMGTSRIMVYHILRNCFSPILVYATMLIGSSILTAASLSFLGLGVPPPTPEWGSMVAFARHNMREAPHIIAIPGTFIFLTVFSFNFLGDVLRDALDPKLKI